MEPPDLLHSAVTSWYDISSPNQAETTLPLGELWGDLGRLLFLLLTPERRHTRQMIRAALARNQTDAADRAPAAYERSSSG